MEILGFQKTTILDYPQHLAATIFLGGCNFNCPFCHNSELIHPPFSAPSYSKDEVLQELEKRKGKLEGVCITGGEPTLQKDLADFLSQIKDLGYLIKLDTNGSHPKLVKELYQKKLLDYVAMDLKSSKETYPILCGVPFFDDSDEKKRKKTHFLEPILETIQFLIHETDSSFDYEFRTTVVNPLHTKEDFEKIGTMISGAKAYYLQSFRPCENPLAHNFSAYDPDTMREFCQIVSPYVLKSQIRNLD